MPSGAAAASAPGSTSTFAKTRDTPTAVFSNEIFYARGGIWTAGGGVQTNRTTESVTEFVNELEGIAGKRPITAAELESAKLARVRGYAQQFESLGRIAGQIAQFWVLGLPMSELQREPEETMKLTVEAVNAAAKKYATPSRASLLLVGDIAKIDAGRSIVEGRRHRSSSTMKASR